MTDSPLSWAALKQLMTTPQPDLVVQGVVSTDERELYFGEVRSEHQAPPLRPVVLADDDGPATLDVRIQGERLRLDHPNGSPYFVVGDEYAWLFEDDPHRPYRDDADRVHYVGTITSLVTRPDADRFEGTDFTRPTGPVTATEYLGRPAWEVELAPPSHKPFPLTYVVDAETGLLLQQRNERAGLLAGWVTFTVGGEFADSVFDWDGPVITEHEQATAHLAEHNADMLRRAEWVEQNVAPQPVTMELTHTGSIHVYHWEADGSFDGSVGEPVASFSRRPAGRTDFPSGDGTTYEWTSGDWRWQVGTYDATMTPAALRSLQEQLHAVPTE